MHSGIGYCVQDKDEAAFEFGQNTAALKAARLSRQPLETTFA